jgi:uncharacterized protein YyaL (SSP411 family)
MRDEGKKANRLARESSPYLLLHRHNPVDWYPWGEEAWRRAREEDKPIFLSVGYSTCYWCHVMERESFSDETVAEMMNREFVNVKVDREERPELDEIYMTATQVLTGHGGWPNSVFLTPRLEPFFAGTYFPPEDRHGQPSFVRVLTSMANAWKNRREEVEEQARSVAGGIRHYLDRRSAPAPEPPGLAVARRALHSLEQRFDARWGGFGGAPKFPTPSNLFLLGEMVDASPNAGEMLATTLDRMARGGIYDQLGGGFHRYATDAEWKVPHFEKMLYDNGLLLELCALEWRRTGDPAMARVVRETAGYLAREMTSPDGPFWSAMDAETDGQEGAFYVWTREELADALGEEDAAFLAPVLGFDGPPFFEGRYYVLHQPRRLETQAEVRQLAPEKLLEEIEPLKRKLFERRSERPSLLVDDKILTDWNGMAIAGLATAGLLLDEPGLADRAAQAAGGLLESVRDSEGVLLHSSRDGAGAVRAFLADYAYLIKGLLALHSAQRDDRWLEAAVALAEEQERRLGDPLGGFFTAAQSADVLVRSKEVTDGAVPAANAIAALNLMELTERTGEGRWRRDADRALRSFAVQVDQQPDAARMMSVAVRRFHGDEPEAEAEASAPNPPLHERAVEAVEHTWVRAEQDDEGWSSIVVSLSVKDGMHLQANPASAEYLVPTQLLVHEAELADVVYPPGEPIASEFVEEPLEVYTGAVEIRARMRGTGDLYLVYQPCSESGCLAPVRVPLGPSLAP